MREIRIEVDSNGDISYSPAVLRAKPGWQISWSAGGRPFTVLFLDKTPFDRQLFEGRKSPTVPARLVGSVGRYRYAVAILQDDRILLDPDCPEIIIE